MRTKDTILLEDIYTNNVLNKRLDKNQYPNKIDPNTLGSEENSIQVEYNGDEYWVDYDADAHKELSKGHGIHPDYNDTVVNNFQVNSIIVNLGEGPEDHIVEITRENNPKLYDIIFNLAKEKYEEEYTEDEYSNPNADNPFSRDYEG
jgi:hypothetical protein